MPFSRSGSSYQVRNLEEQGLITAPCLSVLRFRGPGAEDQAGDYQLSKSMDMFAIADKLTTGDGRPITAKITLIPGGTVEDLAAQLKQQGLIADQQAFLNQCRTGEGLTDYYFIQEALGTSRVQERKYLLEGYLSPNTYEVYTTASPTDILKKFLDQTDKVFSMEWQEQAAQEKLTLDQVLTLASLVRRRANPISPGFGCVPQPLGQQDDLGQRRSSITLRGMARACATTIWPWNPLQYLQ